MTTSPDPKQKDDAEPVRDPDPADEASQASDDRGAGPDGTVPGAATAGGGGAKRAREDDDEG